MSPSFSKTKTNFIEWINCERSAFYSYNGYPGEDLSYPDKAQINQAYKVEEESTKLFPGIKKSHDFDFEIKFLSFGICFFEVVRLGLNFGVRFLFV